MMTDVLKILSKVAFHHAHSIDHDPIYTKAVNTFYIIGGMSTFFTFATIYELTVGRQNISDLRVLLGGLARCSEVTYNQCLNPLVHIFEYLQTAPSENIVLLPMLTTLLFSMIMISDLAILRPLGNTFVKNEAQ